MIESRNDTHSRFVYNKNIFVISVCIYVCIPQDWSQLSKMWCAQHVPMQVLCPTLVKTLLDV